MPALFKCSECGYATKVKDELAGKRIKCPKCQAAGSVTAAAKTSAAKPAPEEESSADLMAVNLNSFQDVEVPEGEVLDESQKASQPKVKKKKKKGKAIPSWVKLAAAGFSLLSLLVMGGLVYATGPVIMEKYQEFLEARNNSGEDKPNKLGQPPAADQPPAAEQAPANAQAPPAAPAP